MKYFTQLLSNAYTIILIFALPIFPITFPSIGGILAHHTGSSHSPTATTRFVDPFTGKREQPTNYLVLTQDYYKATNENSNIYTTTGFVELPFYDGKLAFNLSVPWTYFQQKNRGDAARIGKTYMGGKWLPLGDFQSNFFLVLEANIGFPSGPDTDRFTGGNYYTGQGIVTLGYLWNKWSFVAKAGGIQPLSRLAPSNLQDSDGIPYWARLATGTAAPQRYDLKKATLVQAYITYLWRKEVSFFSGYLYRTPFQGVDFDRDSKDTIPRIFTEGTAGLTYNYSESYNLTIAYRYPFYRKPDHRLYESAWTVAFSMEWGKIDKN